MKTFLNTLSIIIITIISTNGLFAQIGGRDYVNVKPDQLYPEMINAANAGDWGKLNNALTLLEPLSNEIKKYINSHGVVKSELQQATKSQDKAKAKNAIEKYVMDSVNANLKIGENGSHNCDTRKEAIRQALAETITLKPISDAAKLSALQDKLKQLYDGTCK